MSSKSKKISETCVLCFSRGRLLRPISAEQWGVLQSALDGAPLKYSRDLPHKAQYRLCWECQGRLRGAETFLSNVQRSLNCFEAYLASSSKSPSPRSSLLATRPELVSIPATAETLPPAVGPAVGPLGDGLKVETEPSCCDDVYKVELDLQEPEPPPQDSTKQEPSCHTIEPSQPAADDVTQDDKAQDDNTQGDNCQDDAFDRDEVEGLKPGEGVQSGEGSEEKSSGVAERGEEDKSIRKSGKRPLRAAVGKAYSRQWMSTERALGWHALERRDDPHRPFLCPLCRVACADHAALAAHHLDTHHESVGPYECNICRHRFAQQTALLEHTEAHYVLYKCHKCEYETKTLTVMQEHAASHGGKRESSKLDASGGSKGKASEKGSERVKKKPGKRDSYQCRRCKETFGTFPALRRHRASCETYKCDQCEARFDNSPALYRHGKSHSSVEPLHYCATCDTHYKASWFKKHFEISLKHVTRDAYKHECPHCQRRFLVLRRLREHIGSVHLKLGIHKCHLCPKSYMNEKVLKMHQAKIHSIDKVEKLRDKICEHCGKGFTCNLYLKNHMRSHTGERPFQCSLCSRAFAQSGTLYTHIKTVHRKRLTKDGCTDSPGYQCEECGKQFVTNARLQAHYNFYHLKNTNYKCEDCNKMFISVAALKCHRANRHATITTKSLACGTCGKEFRTASARHTHMKTPRPGGVYCA